MKLGIVIFLWVAGAVCLFALGIVIFDLAIWSKDRKKKKAEEKSRKSEEERMRKYREAESAALWRAREAEVRAMQEAARAQENAARAMGAALPKDAASQGKPQARTVTTSSGATIQTTIQVPVNSHPSSAK